MIVSNSDEVLLNMNISGREFAKAKLMQYLNDPGCIVSFIADGSAVYSTWCFSGTKEEGNTMFMTGSAFVGVTLLSILTDPSLQSKRLDAFERVRSAVEQSFNKDITLPLCGPEGTILGSDGSVLFLPQEYMQRSVSFLDDTDASSLFGCYIRPGLNHTDSLRFMLSVYAYHIITQRLPFPKKNTEERIDDYTDNNFIPVQYWNPHISPELADILSHNLSVRSVIKKGKKQKSSMHEQINEIKTIALPALDLHLKNTDIDDYKQLEQSCASERVAFISSQAKKIKLKRFFRQKGTIVKILASIAAVVLILIFSFIRQISNRPSTVGLTPFQVAESFYTSLNELDVTLTSSTTIRSFDKGYKNMISSFYVINKVRTAYDASSQTLHPGQWLYNNRNFADWMYGITNFYIDSTPGDCFSHHHEQGLKRIPLREDKGAVKTLLVTYYLVRHESLEDIVVTECKETVEMEFFKNRWLIKNIISDNTEFNIEAVSFYKLFSSFESSADVYEKARLLSETYSWIPSEKEIQTALEELKARYEQYPF